MWTAIRRWIPILHWIRSYSRSDFIADLQAGVTVAVMLIPQGMAYALLAGLPPIMGLYASIVPLMVYAVLGTSRQLAVGPVAMVSLLVAAGIAPLAEEGSHSYIQYAIVLAGMVGLLQLLMGLLRMGFLVNFLSHPVISGFTSAAALIIGFSQLKHILGIPIDRSHHVHTILWQTLQQLPQIHPPTLGIGLGSLFLLLYFKRRRPAFPAPLVVVLLGTLSVWQLDLAGEGVQIVGNIPAGLPTPTLPTIDGNAIRHLLPMALTIAVVGFLESIAVARAVAAKHRYSVDADQELIGLGLANIAGSFFQGYPVTGGFSRTAVNDQAGARTGMASIITAVGIGLALLFLTSVFQNLPRAVLAAIIMAAVFGLVNLQKIRYLWQVQRSEAFLMLLTFLATLFLGIEPGILLGMAMSLIFFIVRSTRPHHAILGRLPGTPHYRNRERFPDVRQEPGIEVIRIDASFYFANANFLRQRLEQLLYADQQPEVVVLDASSVNYLDATALDTLADMVCRFEENRVELFLASVKGPVRDVLKASGLYDRLGATRFFFSVADAVECWKRRKQGNSGEGCFSEAEPVAGYGSTQLPRK